MTLEVKLQTSIAHVSEEFSDCVVQLPNLYIGTRIPEFLGWARRSRFKDIRSSSSVEHAPTWLIRSARLPLNQHTTHLDRMHRCTEGGWRPEEGCHLHRRPRCSFTRYLRYCASPVDAGLLVPHHAAAALPAPHTQVLALTMYIFASVFFSSSCEPALEPCPTSTRA